MSLPEQVGFLRADFCSSKFILTLILVNKQDGTQGGRGDGDRSGGAVKTGRVGKSKDKSQPNIYNYANIYFN